MYLHATNYTQRGCWHTLHPTDPEQNASCLCLEKFAGSNKVLKTLMGENLPHHDVPRLDIHIKPPQLWY